MKALSVAIASVALAFAGSALAASGADLVKADGCMGCHNGSLGPSFKQVAAKTKGDVKLVTEAIEKGVSGKGYAGVMMHSMPPQAAHKGDAAAIAKWIATQK